MPQDLVSLEAFKEHLRLGTGTEQDSDLLRKLELAEGLVLDYITRDDEDWQAEIAAWTEDDVPAPVAVAILTQATEFYRFRGDTDAPRRDPGDLSDQVKSYLRRYRDPVVR